jgi:glycosyltransferase involved in cell wall biosynthesis
LNKKNRIRTGESVKLVRITTIPLSLDKLLTGQLYFMKSNGFEVVAVSSNGSEIEGIKKREQCRFVKVEMTRTISPLKDLLSLIKMTTLLKKEKPQIVHTHTPKAGLIGMLAAWLAGVPIRLHTVAGLPLMESKGFTKRILIQVEKITYQCASRVYPNSNELQNYIIQNIYRSTTKLKVLGNGSSNGIDVEYYKNTTAISQKAKELKKVLGIAVSDLIFIFIGRIVKDKGVNELVSAFDQLNKKYSSIKLFLVGSFEDELDPIEPRSRAIIEQNKNISTTGFINDIRPYLAASHLLVFPSYREGFPNVPLQAGCFELPMIVTNINGCNEIVRNGINGLIVPSKNEDALRDAMERMIVDEAFRAQCATASRKVIVENYSRDTVWIALLKEYQDLLQAKGISFTHVSKIPETSI